MLLMGFIRLVTAMSSILIIQISSTTTDAHKMLPSALWHGVFICKKGLMKMCTKEAELCGRNGPNPVEADLAQMLKWFG
jgi:hypothetical protein